MQLLYIIINEKQCFKRKNLHFNFVNYQRNYYNFEMYYEGVNDRTSTVHYALCIIIRTAACVIL